MRLPEHGDGPRMEVAPSSGAAARTTGVARPDEGRSQSTSTKPDADAFRQAAWTRLWNRLLEAPGRLVA